MNYFQELSSELVCTVNLYINYIDFNILNLTLNLNFDYSKLLVFKYPAFYSIIYKLKEYKNYSYKDAYNLINESEIVKQYITCHVYKSDPNKFVYGLRDNNIESLIKYILSSKDPKLGNIIRDYKKYTNINPEIIRLRKYILYFPVYHSNECFIDLCINYINIINTTGIDKIIVNMSNNNYDRDDLDFVIPDLYFIYLLILDKPELLNDIKSKCKDKILHINRLIDHPYNNHELILICNLILERLN
jgi:hypothetical protein